MRILDVEPASPSEAARLTAHLVPDEIVHAVYVSPTGALIFTDRRIVIVQREHLLEERIETISWPWRAVRHFSIQEGQTGESRTALRIWLDAEPQPLHLRSGPGAGLAELQALLVRMLG